MIIRRTVSTSVLLILAVVEQPLAAKTPNLFLTGSRAWSRTAEAVVHTDLSKVEPASAVITWQRQKQK